MRILQPAEWSKPRGFSHGVEFNAPGRWVVLAGQTGGDEKGDYPPDMAAQVGIALRRIIKLLAEAGAAPEHIVRLTWYLTSCRYLKLCLRYKYLVEIKFLKNCPWQHSWQRPANFDKSALGKRLITPSCPSPPRRGQ
jgi:enamine deaminase RidA (YjgF/YER057c/UK114 family)